MKQSELKYAFGALSEYEHELLAMYEPSALKHIKKAFNLTYAEAKEKIQGIKDKLKAYQQHEERQEQRGIKLNIGRISKRVQNTNELLIMSEV